MEVTLKSQLNRHSANVMKQEMSPWLDVTITYALSNSSIIAVLESSKNHKRTYGSAVENAKKPLMKPQKNKNCVRNLIAAALENLEKLRKFVTLLPTSAK